MNIFKKKNREEDDWKPTGSFVRKPIKGWIHPDHQLETSGVIYETRYIGAVKIIESMRTVPFDQRGAIVREAISKCCYSSNLFDFKLKKVSLTHGIIGDMLMDSSGENTTTTFSKSSITAISLRNGNVLANHVVENISFASIGENEHKNFIGYISKDPKYLRACFVFECGPGLADDVILTIGQAFELKYKEYLNTNPVIQPVVGRKQKSNGYVNSSSSGLPKSSHLKVVQLPEKFTDPVFDSPRYDEHEIKPGKSKASDGDDLSYSSLFSDLPKKPPGCNGYDTLKRNENCLINTDYDNPNGQLDFAAGTSYGRDEYNYATVYDNPIASPTTRQKMNGFAIYDTPDDQNAGLAQWATDSDPVYLSAVEANKKAKPTAPKQPATNKPPVPKKTPIYREVSISSLSESKTTKAKTLNEETWFHGKISRNDAEKLIERDGEFLVRESGSSDNQYVLTGMRDGQHRHLLLVDPKGQIRTRDHSFESVSDLVKFHLEQNKPIFSGSSEVYLKYEVHNLKDPRVPSPSFQI